jgi:hypothetical protein
LRGRAAASDSKFGEQGLIDILGIARYCAMLAMIMNVTRTAQPKARRSRCRRCRSA